MFVRVQIQFEKHENATVVPIAAVIKRNNSQGVFLIDPDGKTASFVPVTLGIVDSKTAEIHTPALAGSVVVLGQHLLEDGAAIIIPGDREYGKPPAENREKASVKG